MTLALNEVDCLFFGVIDIPLEHRTVGLSAQPLTDGFAVAVGIPLQTRAMKLTVSPGALQRLHTVAIPVRVNAVFNAAFVCIFSFLVAVVIPGFPRTLAFAFFPFALEPEATVDPTPLLHTVFALVAVGVYHQLRLCGFALIPGRNGFGQQRKTCSSQTSNKRNNNRKSEPVGLRRWHIIQCTQLAIDVHATERLCWSGIQGRRCGFGDRV